MSFEVPKSQGREPENRFAFHFAGHKKEWSIPLLQFIPPKIAAQLGSIDENDPAAVMKLLGDLFELIAPGKDLLGQFEDAQQMMDLFNAWQAASMVSLGESKASAES